MRSAHSNDDLTTLRELAIQLTPSRNDKVKVFWKDSLINLSHTDSWNWRNSQKSVCRSVRVFRQRKLEFAAKILYFNLYYEV